MMGGMADPDPMSELEGIHRALRGIQFTLSVCLFVWLWRQIDIPWEARAMVIGVLWVPYMLAWFFFEMCFNARRLKKWW